MADQYRAAGYPVQVGAITALTTFLSTAPNRQLSSFGFANQVAEKSFFKKKKTFDSWTH
jgi:hypothetical protein